MNRLDQYPFIVSAPDASQDELDKLKAEIELSIEVVTAYENPTKSKEIG